MLHANKQQVDKNNTIAPQRRETPIIYALFDGW
jgi:hypothetical protein